jgi:hypothetical protein
MNSCAPLAHILAVQPLARRHGNEELRPVGVRPGIGHRQQACRRHGVPV